MEFLKRILGVVLILLIFNLYLPRIAFSEEGLFFAEADVKKHDPEIMATPEEDIPTVKIKKTSYWTWVILLGLVGGGAAALAGGGGGGSSGGGGSDTGSVTVSW